VLLPSVSPSIKAESQPIPHFKFQAALVQKASLLPC
jgi:hypothetical protein